MASDYSLSHMTTKKILTSEAQLKASEFSPGNEALQKTLTPEANQIVMNIS